MSTAPQHTPLICVAREVNDGKSDHVLEQASKLIGKLPSTPVACFGLAFKANIDDFRESPALKISVELAKRYGRQIRIVEPYTSVLPPEFNGTQARLIDIDQALESCPIIITLTDHDVFKSIPLDERAGKFVYDSRGIWPDQPDNLQAEMGIRLAS